jgi:hypothetical protein
MLPLVRGIGPAANDNLSRIVLEGGGLESTTAWTLRLCVSADYGFLISDVSGRMPMLMAINPTTERAHRRNAFTTARAHPSER